MTNNALWRTETNVNTVNSSPESTTNNITTYDYNIITNQLPDIYLKGTNIVTNSGIRYEQVVYLQSNVITNIT
ncbi:hypothetical protein MEO93_28400, partial [Dolichospermum sp. ST_sed3]|nr:hypothetical protein [Dolichospermum sp. ST_sed3]